MHTQKQAAASAVIPEVPTMINTPTGTVIVWGHEHISAAMLKVLGIVLSHDAFESVYHGVKTVVFRIDGYPKEADKSLCATFAPDTCGIAINMVKTLERALDRSMDHPETSLLACWWIEMLLNFGHEIHHAVRWNTNREELHCNVKELKEEEDRAVKYSESLIPDLAKEYDIEPPAITEEIWFNGQIMELFTGKNDEDPWAIAQEEMIQNQWLWKTNTKDGAPIIVYTFKDLACLLSDGDVEAEEWNRPTITVKEGSVSLDEQLNGKKVVIDTANNTTPIVDPKPVTTQAPQEESNYDQAINGDFDGDYGCDEEIPPLPSPQQPVAVQKAVETGNNFNFTQPESTEQSAGTIHDIATISRVAKQVYIKMYEFIFKNCGPIKDSDVGFTNPEAVCSTALPLTAEEASIFVSMNHNDINGRWCTNVPTTNGLFGKIMKNTKLPSYEMILNINGVTHRRLFVPQNPMKRNSNGQLTTRALEARAGNAIAYIINPDDDTNSKWGPYIINGEYKLPQTKS